MDFNSAFQEWTPLPSPCDSTRNFPSTLKQVPKCLGKLPRYINLVVIHHSYSVLIFIVSMLLLYTVLFTGHWSPDSLLDVETLYNTFDRSLIVYIN